MGVKEDSDGYALRLEGRADLMGEFCVFLEALRVRWVQILDQHHAAMATIIS